MVFEFKHKHNVRTAKSRVVFRYAKKELVSYCGFACSLAEEDLPVLYQGNGLTHLGPSRRGPSA